jgi:uncharacterized circularly permuted ATP-grasp superfamily protein
MDPRSEPFTDSHTLMAAFFHSQARTKALTDFVLETKEFEQIEANVMVKEPLITFLHADTAFRKAVAEYRLLPWYVRKNRWSKVSRQAEENLDELRAKLAEAYRELEFMRKLALPDNSLLMLRPYVFSLPSKRSGRSQSKQ